MSFEDPTYDLDVVVMEPYTHTFSNLSILSIYPKKTINAEGFEGEIFLLLVGQLEEQLTGFEMW